jgi:hypothetical protein
MNRPHNHQAPGDALVRRHIAHWRRITARLQVLVNTGSGSAALADEAHTLRRQCERLAGELGRVADGALAATACPTPRTGPGNTSHGAAVPPGVSEVPST